MAILSYEDMYNSRNNMRLREIFCEWEPEAILTLHRFGKEGKVNLFKLYMAHCVDDPSEVAFAEQVFGDLLFWEALSQASFFKAHIEEWRRAADIKRKSKAFKVIVSEVNENGKYAFAAAKYLVEEPWKGGPTAADKRKAKKRSSETAEEAYKEALIAEDVERLKEQGILN